MTLLIGSLQLGCLYGLLAIGIYISFRILNVPDLTAEGSFTFGLAVSAVFSLMGHPGIGILMAALAGGLAGSITGLLQTKAKIHPIVAGILTMSGLYSINLVLMGSSSNLSLLNGTTIFKVIYEKLPMDKEMVKLIMCIAVTILGVAIMIAFFKTHVGMCIRATGDNEDMVSASSIDVDAMKILALILSNASIGLSGGLIAQYQGYADINSGVGILVVGLASVIIGEVFFGKRSVTIGFISAIVGSIVYRLIIAFAIKSQIFPAYCLKLVSAVIVGVALSIPAIKGSIRFHAMKKGKGGEDHA